MNSGRNLIFEEIEWFNGQRDGTAVFNNTYLQLPSTHANTRTTAAMSGSTLPQAFGLVRQLLADRPRVFQDLLRDGISAVSSSSSASASSSASGASGVSGAMLKGKGKLRAGETLVPDGHPFVSAK